MVSASDMELPEGCGVDLWRIDIAGGSATWESLSGAERERARAFAFERDRARYVASRAALRDVLARYLKVRDSEVSLILLPDGKPALDPDAHGAPLPSFNLSHSGDLAVLAVAGRGQIGVDLERTAPAPARSFMLDMFSPEERAAAQSLPEQDLAAAFRVAWTRKEACLKAIGVGFALPARALHVGLERGARAVRVPAGPGNPADPAASTVHVLTLPASGDATISLARVEEPFDAVRSLPYAKR